MSLKELSLMHRILRAASVLCILLFSAAQAPAEDVKRYAVLPFAVNGPAGFSYLEKAVPSMLSSRLFLQGRFQPVAEDAAARAGKPASAAAAAKSLASLDADYVVWGTVSIVNDDAAVDVRALDKNGKEWRKTSNSKVGDLIQELQNTADAVNAELFGRSPGGAAARQSAGRPLNPELVHNEAVQRDVYLNPQFRYQGGDGSRLRTQNLPFATVSMAVADVTGDGKNEIVLLSEKKLHVYTWGERLTLLGEYDLPRNQIPLQVRTIDLDRDRTGEIVVATYDPDYTEPYSYVLSFKGRKFSVIADRVRAYLSVAKLRPDFRPVLIGQRGDPQRIFGRDGVREMIKQGNTFVFGRKVELAEGANVFNFVWLPGDGEGDKLIVLTGDEHLKVFGPAGSSLYRSDDTYSGSATGIAEQTGMPGLGKGGDVIARSYYIPLRMIAADLDRNGSWELLVNKPVSVASQFFDRYRSFPEGEIQALYWDGVGLGMLWKTRRIKGSVADFDLGDANNDGMQDLTVALNTHRGALGLKNRKTVIVAYPLDLEQADPNTPPAVER